MKKNKYYCGNEEVTIEDIVGWKVGKINYDSVYRRNRSNSGYRLLRSIGYKQLQKGKQVW